MIMGVIGYVVKLSEFTPCRKSASFHYRRPDTDSDFLLPVHIPVNNILVGGA